MTNKTVGNTFEREFCETLFDDGFWVHNMAQNASGQPADIIAVRRMDAYLIDCKVCKNDTFRLYRIEENQRLAMTLWEERALTSCWFALKTSEGIYMLAFYRLKVLESFGLKTLSMDAIKREGFRYEDWRTTF